jgi:hypothetical protein
MLLVQILLRLPLNAALLGFVAPLTSVAHLQALHVVFFDLIGI